MEITNSPLLNRPSQEASEIKPLVHFNQPSVDSLSSSKESLASYQSGLRGLVQEIFWSMGAAFRWVNDSIKSFFRWICSCGFEPTPKEGCLQWSPVKRVVDEVLSHSVVMDDFQKGYYVMEMGNQKLTGFINPGDENEAISKAKEWFDAQMKDKSFRRCEIRAVLIPRKNESTPAGWITSAIPDIGKELKVVSGSIFIPPGHQYETRFGTERMVRKFDFENEAVLKGQIEDQVLKFYQPKYTRQQIMG